METWIKIDELRPIVESLNSNKITYGKAIELITEYCRNRTELSKLSQHDVVKSVCDCKAPTYRDEHRNHRCTKCNVLKNSD